MKRKRLRVDEVARIAKDSEAWGRRYWDDVVRGLVLRVSKKGHCAWVVMRRVRGERRPTRITIGNAARMRLERAREEARRVLEDMDAGVNPMQKRRAERRERALKAQDVGGLKAQARLYLAQVSPELRSAARLQRVFDDIIVPAWGNLSPRDVRRRNVMDLLDKIEKERGPASRRGVLSIMRRFFNWYALRDDGFTSPIIKGMETYRNKARARILNDDELRALWVACDEAKPRVFGKIVRVLLLTGQRRLEIGEALWGEIKDGVLVVPPERYKTGVEQRVPLSEAVQAILADVPKHSDFIFSVLGDLPFRGYARSKSDLDERMLAHLRKAKGDEAELPNWTLHDLRRTARSLMARAGVRPDHAERVLGHLIRGVERVYDRHTYEKEKAEALTALAELIARIVSGQSAEVVQFRAAS